MANNPFSPEDMHRIYNTAKANTTMSEKLFRLTIDAGVVAIRFIKKNPLTSVDLFLNKNSTARSLVIAGARATKAVITAPVNIVRRKPKIVINEIPNYNIYAENVVALLNSINVLLLRFPELRGLINTVYIASLIRLLVVFISLLLVVPRLLGTIVKHNGIERELLHKLSSGTDVSIVTKALNKLNGK